ncbi:MAG TPA: transcriptional repressor NrdR [Anaerolineae bacterium]|nr:transcriptional repressor NrdR [Anaerolineae bacterium]
MKCPYCTKWDSRVIDTRRTGDGIRRRRECMACGRRFTTYERVALGNLLVVKRDGRREEFDREKLMMGLRKACAKRPVSAKTLEQVVSEIEGELYALGEAEVESKVIGEKVMERLRELDEVAYVRFASVYRHFADVESLAEEIERLLESKRREEELKRQLRLEL